MKKKVITCASYGGTGSSVITDLLKEFENVKSLGNAEFSIAHDVDGISDLQHSLVDDWHRLKNDEAIYRFKKLSKMYKGFEKIFNIDIEKITQKYIESLIDIEWNGYWMQHELRITRWKRLINYRIPYIIQAWSYLILRKVKSSFKIKTNIDYEYVPYFKRQKMYFSKPENEFYNLTRKYFNNIFVELDKENKYEYIALDQLVPPTNIKRYLKYFDNIKIVVVDRDPRDLYILNKKFWNEGWIPTEDINVYIKWFKALRESKKNENIDSNKVLYIKFENLIYNYDEELKNILEFLELKNTEHKMKKMYFDPQKSIKNTRLWINNNEFVNEINLIERELKEYCYKI